MKTAIIGMGNMGTMLLETFIEYRSLGHEQIFISNRSKVKLAQLKDRFVEVIIAENNEEAIKNAELIFLCAKPNEILSIVSEHKDLFTSEKCLVSITSPIEVAWLEKLTNSHCIRMIPSITNRAKSGVTLLTFGDHCHKKYRDFLLNICSTFSTPVEIKEENIRISSDIVSCGPAFLSFILRNMIEEAMHVSKIDEKSATLLMTEMLSGMGKLIKQDFYSLQTLEDKVCVKGGITGEGLQVLDEELHGVFEKVYLKTNKKFIDEKGHLIEKYNLK